MKYLKLFEDIKIDDDEWEEEIEEESDPLTISELKQGMKVICISDCVNGNARGNGKFIEKQKDILPIKNGEIKVIKGYGTLVWFNDTPGGWGAYEVENFEII